MYREGILHFTELITLQYYARYILLRCVTIYTCITCCCLVQCKSGGQSCDTDIMSTCLYTTIRSVYQLTPGVAMLINRTVRDNISGGFIPPALEYWPPVATRTSRSVVRLRMRGQTPSKVHRTPTLRMRMYLCEEKLFQMLCVLQQQPLRKHCHHHQHRLHRVHNRILHRPNHPTRP